MGVFPAGAYTVYAMNKTILALLVLSSPASAQVASQLPGGRGSLYIGSAISLPGPAAGVVINPRISLPAPLLTPAIAVFPAPASIPALPVSEVAAKPLALPAAHAATALALPSAIPPAALTLQLGAASTGDSAPVTKEQLAQRERLDGLFDGARLPADRRERADERGPIRSGRHVSLPENDLEREIGAY